MADPCESCAWIYHQLVHSLTKEAAQPQLEQFTQAAKKGTGTIAEWIPAFGVARVQQLVDPTGSWRQFDPSEIDKPYQSARAANRAVFGTQVASPLAQILLPGALQAATSMLGHAVGYTNTATNAAPNPTGQR